MERKIDLDQREKKGKRSHSIIVNKKYWFFLITLLAISQLTRSSSYPMASSYFLDVPYHDQKENTYCGPATLQMLLEYSEGVKLSQEELGAELETDIVGGTFTYAMDEPLQNRMLSKVNSGRTTLTQLKQRINQGYASILLIWFDDTHENAHYVVAVGYNETGIFINDPWPKKWNPPVGRETGSYVYLSNEKLSDLWSNYFQWSMTMPLSNPEEKFLQVDVALNGVPEDAKTMLYLNGNPIERLNGTDKTSIQLRDEPDYHFLRVDITIQDDDGLQYLCKTPSLPVDQSGDIEFNYQPFRQLNP